MHDGVEIIHAHPTGILLAFRVARQLAVFLFQPLVYIFGNRFHLCVGVAFANNKKVGRCIVEFPQIQLHDIFAFDVLDAVNDQVIEHFGIGGLAFYSCLYAQNIDLVFTFENEGWCI